MAAALVFVCVALTTMRHAGINCYATDAERLVRCLVSLEKLTPGVVS